VLGGSSDPSSPRPSLGSGKLRARQLSHLRIMLRIYTKSLASSLALPVAVGR
jgi:hypothetical protein